MNTKENGEMMGTRTAPTGAPAVSSSGSWTPSRVLLAVGAAGTMVFLAVAALLGFFQPGYDLMTRSVSELALGRYGLVQTMSFYETGVSFIVFALGSFLALRRRSPVTTALASVLIFVSGAGLVMSGVFPTDPAEGPETGTGALHDLMALVTFFPLILAYPFAALALRKVPGWRRYALLTALLAPVVFGALLLYVAFATDLADPLYFVGGVVQRVMIALSFGWIALTGWRPERCRDDATSTVRRCRSSGGSRRHRGGRVPPRCFPRPGVTSSWRMEAEPRVPPPHEKNRSTRR